MIRHDTGPVKEHMTDKGTKTFDTKRFFAAAKLILLVAFLIGMPVFLYLNCRDTLLNKEWLSDLPAMLGAHKLQAALILGGLQALQVIICIIPGQPIQFAASYIFGVVRGLLISVAGAIVGATVAFYIARLLGRDFLHMIFGEERIEEYRRKLNSGKGLLMVLLIYLLPGVPKDLAGYAAGVSEMRFRYFILLSSIGRIPGMLGSLLTGYFFRNKNYIGIAVVAVVMGAIVIICLVRRSALTAMLDRLESEAK